MKYDHWTKIDDGSEGAWAPDVWLSTLQIINRHKGELIYDENSKIYEDLEKEIPELSWRTYENGKFRPYFRDFSKPWTVTEVANFDTTFKIGSQGLELLNSDTPFNEFWLNFLSKYVENDEYPFVELSNAFLKVSRSISIEEVYWGIVVSYRARNESEPDFDHIPTEKTPSVAKRRLSLMLQFLERTGGITSTGNGAKKRWMKWDEKALRRITKKNLNEPTLSTNLLSTLLSKPFLLLAGISGTGKTRFVREQATATGSISDTYCLTSVRPDWHEPSDILGYISRLGGDGNAEYITTNVLQFIAKAWREIIDAELWPKVDDESRLTVTGNKNQLNKVRPYWLCLDEMNLAPVEQYFADYLSILETREWQWHDNDSFDYRCDPILKAATIEQLEDKNKLRDALGFRDEKYNAVWDSFCQHGLSLPFNLIVAGTVNMDETTHGFSRKVIDRALSFDFGDFFPNEFDNFFEPKFTHNALTYPIYSQASIDKLPPIDSDGSKSINFLKSINKVLDDTPFQLAFRALNELLLAVISTYPEDEKQLQAVWDDFLMCKVLPRIEGDHDKLAVIDDSVSSHEKSLLTELTATLKQELVDIWSMEDDQDKLRPDLYRKNIDGNVLNITCRSKAKLAWMQQRLERSGFTSFWP